VLSTKAIITLRRALARLPRDSAFLSAVTGRDPIQSFERAFADSVGGQFALGLPTGTAALTTALAVAGVGLGDELILSALSWEGVLGPVLSTHCTCVFADVAPRSFSIDPQSVARLITPRTRAILASHWYGCPADVPPLWRLTKRAGVPLIVDACQGFGAEINGRPVGAYGDLLCFSLGRGPAKVLFAGEGGVLIANARALYERAVLASQHSLRAHRQIEDPQLRALLDDGYSLGLRLHPLIAVLAAAQLRELQASAHLAALKSQYAQTCAHLKRTGLGKHLPRVGGGGVPNGTILPLFADSRAGLEKLLAPCRRAGFPVEPGFMPLLHLSSPIAGHFDALRGWKIARHGSHQTGSCPRAERLVFALIDLELRLGDIRGVRGGRRAGRHTDHSSVCRAESVSQPVFLPCCPNAHCANDCKSLR
jgi:dTDP-4-amino-4,6-dideoxygalactose transaminase